MKKLSTFSSCLLGAIMLFSAAGCVHLKDSEGYSGADPDSRGSEGASVSSSVSGSDFSGSADTGGNADSSFSSSDKNSSEEEGMKDYWENSSYRGIQVTDEGVMTLGGKPLYLAGVNCFNLFNQCVSLGFSDAEAKATLDVLKEYGVKVLRFDCGGFDFRYISDYYGNRSKYVNLLVRIAKYAEECRIGLIPSFFWLDHAVPDYYDEPIRAWGDTKSRTVGFLREYTRTIVEALKDYKSVFGWEFGNEFNLACDLPNAAEHMPALPPHSTRTERTEEDYLSATDVSVAYAEFASLIRQIDRSGRMITSGNASLRPSQYHQLHDNSWEQDSEAQYLEMTDLYTPGEMDVVCEHIYFTEQKTFGELLSLPEYLSRLTAMARTLGKGFFVGEWGGGSSNDYTYYRDIADDFVDAGVQLCLLWNFNLRENSTEYSFSADVERGQKLLKIVEDMNKRYEKEF